MTKFLLATVAMVTVAIGLLSSPLSFAADNLVGLPVSGLAVAEKNGKLRYVSDNGRFLLEGRMYDTWNKEYIDSLEMADRASKYIDFQKMKFNVGDLDPLVLGTGKKQVTIFVDPYCGFCHKMFMQMQELKNEYTFNIVQLPILGESSVSRVRDVLCAEDKVEALNSVLAGDNKTSLKQTATCDQLPVNKRLVTAQFFAIKGVPHSIRQDGFITKGFIPDLKSWLAQGKG
ncbi:DsbC family protein (plasmid) [Pseudomonas mandelii]|uniref:DsbC family protein n=1 Tax=Pseudomonas mandelii TaxID=75612 RepID=UPI00398D26EC